MFFFSSVAWRHLLAVATSIVDAVFFTYLWRTCADAYEG